LSAEKQAEYAEKAEIIRQQMIRYLERVEKQIGVQEKLERNL
jgi:hypothetical protein